MIIARPQMLHILYHLSISNQSLENLDSFGFWIVLDQGCGMVTMASHEEAERVLEQLDLKHTFDGLEGPMMLKWVDQELQKRRKMGAPPGGPAGFGGFGGFGGPHMAGPGDHPRLTQLAVWFGLLRVFLMYG